MRRPIPALLLGLAFIGAPGLSAAPSPAGGSAAGEIVFLMPEPDSFIPGGPVVVAGRLPAGVGGASLLLDGEPVADVTVADGTFSVRLSPVPGRHELEVRAGEGAARLSFVYARGGAGASPSRYHRPELEERCVECHAGLRGPAARGERQTCAGCPRALAVIFPYVNGPVAAGQCLVCHDPHGSSGPALAPAGARDLCTRCHDQPSTMSHVEKARSKVCYLCHNPHASMNRRLLYDIVK